ncbi:Fc.00g002120.m01.CDS01 [Cosmosporella sp. VM-42]
MTASNGTPEINSAKPSQAQNPFSLALRTILVTGATGGLGLSLVESLLQAGADVIAIDRCEKPPSNSSWDDLHATAKTTGTNLTYYGCDISNLEVTDLVFEKAVSKSRFPLRGIVNCAGIGWVGDSIDFPINEAKRIIEVNLIGTLIVAQAGAKLVQKHNLAASFVFIASMSGHIVQKGTPTAAYSASKAGVHQLTRNLAAEWGCWKDGPTIRVNSISPGVIRTPMTSNILKDKKHEEVWTEMTFLKRLSEPQDFRGPAIFLLSDASSYVTGADLVVDGGYTGF